LFFWDRILHTPGWPQTCYVANTSLELEILLLPPPRCWDLQVCASTHGSFPTLNSYKLLSS
jgi:hypothetical protein